MRTHLIAYDISDNRRRTAAARLLEKAGRRMQKSLFIVELRETALAALEQELQEILADNHSLLILPISVDCAAQARYYGLLPPLAIIA